MNAEPVLEEIKLNPKKKIKGLSWKDEEKELKEAIDTIINMLDVNLLRDVHEYAGCFDEPYELLVKGSYVDKVYFLETLLLFLTEDKNSRLYLYEDKRTETVYMLKEEDKTYVKEI